MKSIPEIILGLKLCSDLLNDDDCEHVCKLCPYVMECTVGSELMADAAAALEKTLWRDPADEPPEPNKPLIVARVREKGKPYVVEQGFPPINGWWKVYGSNVRKVVAWRPMPDPPEKGELSWVKD